MFTVANRYAATGVIDQFHFSQLLCNTCDTRTIDAQGPSDLLVRQLERAATAAVLNHQQPGAQAFFYRVVHIADRFLRDLLDIQVDEFIQASSQPLVRP